MSYRVILNERAEAQLELAYLWWREHRSVQEATRWYNGFLDCLIMRIAIRSSLI